MEESAPQSEINKIDEPGSAAPLDLHLSPENSSLQQTETLNSQEVLNKSTESVDSKKSDSSPGKSRRKRKPNVTKKVSLSDLSEPNNDCETGDIESDLIANVITSEQLKPANPESDDCETIDKIAQMVSNITSQNTEAVPETEMIVSQKSNDEAIEHQLEQMFADCAEQKDENETIVVPTTTEAEPTSIEQKSSKKKTTQARPRKKKVDGVSARKKVPAAGVLKLKNGKLGKKTKNVSESIDKIEPKDKSKSKENKKVRVKADVAPFLQIQKDGSFAIVNQKANGDDDPEKTVSKPKKGPQTEKNKVIRGLHVSTLSNKYDADKRDATWVCVFCKLGPHKHKLGDLFGPYIISSTSEEYSNCLQDPATDIFRQGNKNKFVKAVLPPPSPEKPKKKKKMNDAQKAAVTVNGSLISNEELFSGMSKVDETNLEVWFHEDCIVWANGTYIIGTKIIGMEAAIWSSTRFRCAYCEKNGAMISCLSRECRKPAHIGCAKNIWKLDDEFKSFCELHDKIVTTK